MIPFARLAGGGGRLVQLLTSTSSTIYPPVGATQLIIECIGGGCGGKDSSSEEVVYSGGGGAYSRSTVPAQPVYAVVGAGGAPNWTTRGGSSYVVGSGTGVTLCSAAGSLGQGGGLVSNGVGDVRYKGGDGAALQYLGGTDGGPIGAGGAAGPDGNGTNGTRYAAGLGGGDLAGNGGRCLTRGDTANGVGKQYGGGGGSYLDSVNGSTACAGAQGVVRLTWI